MSISLCTQIYNRNSFLNQTLPTWLSRSDISEVVIFNWYSDDPFTVVEDKRVKIVRLKDDIPYNIAIAKNVSIRAAKHDIVLYLDCDVKIGTSFPEIKNIGLDQHCFFMGTTEEINPANGSMLLYKQQFLQINGFNERLTSYGYEEYDFSYRLKDKGFIWKYLPEGLDHIHHSDALRSSSYSEKDIFLSSLKNKLRTADKPWTMEDKQMRHNVRIETILESTEEVI